MQEKFSMKPAQLIKIVCCLAIVVVFWIMPPAAPITDVGMKVIGVFIATVLMLSLVDPLWPALLALVMLSRTGVMSLNDTIAGSFGSWITYFVVMSFIMTVDRKSVV